MDSPQYEYLSYQVSNFNIYYSFKPYYKWIVLNTEKAVHENIENLESFKPYYKWIVLNT